MFETEEDYDVVELINSDGVIQQSYSGALGQFDSTWVSGNQVNIRLATDSTYTSYGFDVTGFTFSKEPLSSESGDGGGSGSSRGNYWWLYLLILILPVIVAFVCFFYWCNNYRKRRTADHPPSYTDVQMVSTNTSVPTKSRPGHDTWEVDLTSFSYENSI